jgi:hypothetical protein
MVANPEGATVEGAAKKIASLFSEPKKPTEPTGSETPKNEAVEAQADTKTDEAETPKGDTETNSRIVKAKLDDFDIELQVLTDGVDLDLIPKGLMMEADYRKKTTEVANRRKQLEEEESKLQEQLKDLETMLHGERLELGSPEMLELKQDDPAEYLKRVEKFENKSKKAKQYKEQTQKKLLDKQNEIIKKEIESYPEVIPEWHDEKVRDKDFKEMAGYLKGLGFSDDELGSIYDRRLVKAFREAAKYNSLKSAQIEHKRVKTAPKTQRPGTAEKEPLKTNSARDRLKKSGKIQDAQQALKAFLGE